MNISMMILGLTSVQVLLGLTPLILLGLLAVTIYISDMVVWHGGICKKCGGKMKYTGFSRECGYICKCEKCGREASTIFKKKGKFDSVKPQEPTKIQKVMREIYEVPEYVLEDIDNTLRQCFNAFDNEDSCLVRNIQTSRIQIAKILNGEKLTGNERVEAMKQLEKTRK